MTSQVAKAENELRAAMREIQNALPKDARADVAQISFPQFENISAVDENAAELQVAIDKLMDIRNGRKLDPQGRERIKEYLRKWYRTSYPFARSFIIASQGASAVISHLWTPQLMSSYLYSIPMG